MVCEFGRRPSGHSAAGPRDPVWIEVYGQASGKLEAADPALQRTRSRSRRCSSEFRFGVCERRSPRNHPWQHPKDRTMSAIWLTPLFGVPEIRDRAATSGLRSLIVAGSVDPYHDPAGLDAVASALAASTLVVPNADHALEVRGDVLGTLHAMHSLTRAVLEFAA